MGETLLTIHALRRRALAKKAQLESLLSRIKPDIAVIDSEYTVFP